MMYSHESIKKLTEAKFTEEQAQAIKETQLEELEKFVQISDLQKISNEIMFAIGKLKNDIKDDIKDLKHELRNEFKDGIKDLKDELKGDISWLKNDFNTLNTKLEKQNTTLYWIGLIALAIFGLVGAPFIGKFF